jgi:hypothetical protein
MITTMQAERCDVPGRPSECCRTMSGTFQFRDLSNTNSFLVPLWRRSHRHTISYRALLLCLKGGRTSSPRRSDDGVGQRHRPVLFSKDARVVAVAPKPFSKVLGVWHCIKVQENVSIMPTRASTSRKCLAANLHSRLNIM